MFPRLSVCSLLGTLAPAVVAGCGLFAAPAVAATAVVTYGIDNHAHLATVKDAAGKTLLTRRVTTPTLRAVVALRAMAAKDPHAAPSPSHTLSLTLEDGDGHPLWSAPVAPPPALGVVHSLQFAVNSSSAVEGTRIVFTFSTEEAPPTSGTSSDDRSTDGTLVCVIGEGGRLVNMEADDTKGTKAAMLIGPKGFSINGSDGHSQPVAVGFTAAKRGGVMDINGNDVPLTTVKRDGKQYLSFPWNGHNVFVGDGCTFTIDGVGNLTVDGPAAPAGK